VRVLLELTCKKSKSEKQPQRLIVTDNIIPCTLILSALKLETTSAYENLVLKTPTWSHSPEYGILPSYRYEDLTQD
jgi:hypothetical protein